jgi:hypothetical protein
MLSVSEAPLSPDRPQIKLADRLCDTDETARAFAAEDAGYDDRADEVDPLFDRLLVETSRIVREAIAAALCRMTQARVSERAVGLLATQDAFLRSTAVSVLQAHPESIALVEGVYPAANEHVRKLILDAASAVRSESSDRLLIRGLEDADLNVRIAAVEYLGERARPELKGYFERILRTEEDPMLLATALSAVDPIGDETTWATLHARYQDSSKCPPFLVPQLLQAMAKWAPGASLGDFLEMACGLSPTAFEDWVDGIESLQARFDVRAISAAELNCVEGALERCATGRARFRILDWMGRLKDQPGVAALLGRYLEHTKPSIQSGAAAGLARLGNVEAERLLAERRAAEVTDDPHAASKREAPRLARE